MLFLREDLTIRTAKVEQPIRSLVNLQMNFFGLKKVELFVDKLHFYSLIEYLQTELCY